MNEDRKRILAMLADGKITADEAERLLDAMGSRSAPPPYVADGSNKSRRSTSGSRSTSTTTGDGQTKVNVRIPMQLLRAGVRLGALIPPRARDEVNAAMAREGIAVRHQPASSPRTSRS